MEEGPCTKVGEESPLSHRMSLFSLSEQVTKTPVRCMSRETLRRA